MKVWQGHLKGINLGGWLSQGSLEEKHLRSFIIEKDIETIASKGFDHVRLPVDYENLEDEEGDPKSLGYELIRKCILWCRKYSLNLVLDLHKTAGYSFDGEDTLGFFESEELQKRFYNLWDHISKAFASDSDVVSFELLNEVVRKDVAKKWNEIAHHCFKVIRKNAPTVKILLGGVENNAVTSIPLLPKPWDENVIYNFHCYSPLIFTHQGAYWIKAMPTSFRLSFHNDMAAYRAAHQSIFSSNGDLDIDVEKIDESYFEKLFAKAIEVADKLDVALYCGEYGVIDLADPKESLLWYQAIHKVFNRHGIGHATWTYKEKDFGLFGEHYDLVRGEIIASL